MKRSILLSTALLFVTIIGGWCGYLLGRSTRLIPEPTVIKAANPESGIGRMVADQIRLRKFEANDIPLIEALKQLEHQVNETLIVPPEELHFKIVNPTLCNVNVTIILRDPLLITILDLISEQTNLAYSIQIPTDSPTCEIRFYSVSDEISDDEGIDADSNENARLLPALLPNLPNKAHSRHLFRREFSLPWASNL